MRGVPIWEAAGFRGMSPKYSRTPTATILHGARRPRLPEGRYVSVAETVVNLTEEGNQTKNSRKSGRSGRIRTCDPCVPNAVLYRAEPHSD
jgi:hypothetical protein